MSSIVESPSFERLWPRYWDTAAHSSFIRFITDNPRDGNVVPRSGGVRKIRWARSGTGKSGGVRVIYFTSDGANKIILLTIYAKATTANMTAAQLKELRRDYEKIFAPQR